MKQRVVKLVLSLTLAATMTITSVVPAMAGGSSDPNASAAREATNAQISQDAATQGMVLLDNSNGVLPIAKSGNVALYGTGVYETVTGGTGSGSVNLKEGAEINVQQGFENAGYNIVNKEYLAAEEARYQKLSAEYSSGSSGMWGSYSHDEEVYSQADVTAAAEKSDIAIYVLTRNSGEGADRTATKGDYYLSDNEAANLTMLGKTFKTVIVALNVGGVVDVNFYTGKHGATDSEGLNRGKIEGLDALFLMSQAGMNGGNALVEVLNGTVNPSGKLTDTWAVEYSDYPSSENFSFNGDALTDANGNALVLNGETVTDGETLEEIYNEDIYVGYRYFDTFGVDVAYPFGYGGSYTSFDISVTSVTATASTVTVKADVKNTGSVDGKEVVEVYFSAPTGSLDKPYQELAAYKKVSVKAGQTQSVTITFDTTDMSSYDENNEAYVMEDGDYTIRVGNSSRNTVVAGTITLDKDVITEYCQNNLGLTKDAMQNGTYTEGTILHNTYSIGKTTSMFGESEGISGTPQYGTDKVEGLLDENSKGYGTGITPTTTGLSATKASVSLSSSSFAKAITHTYTNGNITTYVSSDSSKDSAKYASGKSSTTTTDLGTETLQTVEAADGATLVDVVEGKITVEQLVADMSNEELADLVEGGSYSELSAGNTSASAIIGAQSDSVDGAAGETTQNLYTSRYIPNIVMSDGPAGLRISTNYIQYDAVVTGDTYDSSKTYYTKQSGMFSSSYSKVDIADDAALQAELAKGTQLYATDNTTYYQYCTAFPIGTLLAMTWDTDLIKSVGRAIQTEMLEYGVTSYLAPGMNIHRNPLCGRNFEYYSEDPLIAGLTAAAETEGVETLADGSSSGVGVTLKHFAFNNQEEDRSGSNAVVSERAAREIYLRGFQIAVENSQPDYIMTSYNMVNGTSTFENYGLITETLRNEWGFEGFVMTDWMSPNSVFGKNKDKNSRGLLMYAGNDCEMPGSNETQLLSALSEGTTMRLGDLQRSAINMLNVIKQTAVFDIMKAKLDASPSISKETTKTNSAGKTVTVTTTTNKNSSGTVTGSKEVSVIESAAKNTSVTVTVEKSAAGKVTSAKAVVTKTGTTSGSSTKVSIPATVVSQIQEAAGQDSVDVTVKVVNAAGTLKYNLKVNAKNLAAGKTLYAYALNTKTGEYTAVNSTKYTVTSSGSLAVTLSKKATYELVTAKSASAISKNILATVKAAKSSVTLKKGKTTTFGLSSKLNQSNVKSISYTTSKKTVATVSKAGKITAKKAGTATIKAKVTLKNGKTKTVSTKVTVK